MDFITKLLPSGTDNARGLWEITDRLTKAVPVEAMGSRRQKPVPRDSCRCISGPTAQAHAVAQHDLPPTDGRCDGQDETTQLLVYPGPADNANYPGVEGFETADLPTILAVSVTTRHHDPAPVGQAAEESIARSYGSTFNCREAGKVRSSLTVISGAVCVGRSKVEPTFYCGDD
ncbi:hypothetical protein CONLIGDRAFT_685779 [Coniochaeta ligniaria NRRL 30616]|uniref:Uncharacterized protein n=1 Tax=Coniochaeta ligniaria NRRL 30616 TaxID=1408157 RepID=A0A1J7IA14_9PEZI|nr:hypothetical protein CONLIGDRAFT_685779 [Coniochaeta ligniaria NRRL 30616]